MDGPNGQAGTTSELSRRKERRRKETSCRQIKNSPPDEQDPGKRKNGSSVFFCVVALGSRLRLWNVKPHEFITTVRICDSAVIRPVLFVNLAPLPWLCRPPLTNVVLADTPVGQSNGGAAADSHFQQTHRRCGSPPCTRRIDAGCRPSQR